MKCYPSSVGYLTVDKALLPVSVHLLQQCGIASGINSIVTTFQVVVIPCNSISLASQKIVSNHCTTGHLQCRK